MHDLIPVAAPLIQFQKHAPEIRAAVERVLSSGWYILGPEVEQFEQEFANYLDVQSCIGVANGTDAVALALRSCGVSPGDEVITVSHSAVATVAAIEQIGAIPVFADIEPVTRCINPALISALVSPATRAIVPVHIYGQPASMHEIMAVASTYNLIVVEDCAQTHGAAIDGKKVGSFGDAAAFSFYPTKNLGAFGDGGAVVTDNRDIADKCRSLREYGWKSRYISDCQGVNSRLDELQAAILRVKLSFLESGNRMRRSIAKRYTEAMRCTSLTPPADVVGCLHAMHLYVAETSDRERFQLFLQNNGIASARHYPLPVHLQPAYKGRIRGASSLPVTGKLYDRIITLPMFPELEEHQVEKICTVLKKWK